MSIVEFIEAHKDDYLEELKEFLRIASISTNKEHEWDVRRAAGWVPFVAQMDTLLKIPCVLLGFGLPDENAHAPDEHLSLENYFGGLRSVSPFYQSLGTGDGQN